MHRLEPRNLRVQNDLQLTHLRLARTLSSLGRPETEAQGHFLKAIQLYEGLLEANPRNVEIRLRGAEAYRFFGIHLFQRRRLGAARIQLEKSLQFLEGRGSQRPSHIHFSLALAETCRALAKVEDALVPGRGRMPRQRALTVDDEHPVGADAEAAIAENEGLGGADGDRVRAGGPKTGQDVHLGAGPGRGSGRGRNRSPHPVQRHRRRL